MLERRALLALTSSVAAGALTVASNADDNIEITCVTGDVKINGADPDTGVAACASLISIAVEGGPGGNTINLSGVTAGEFTLLTSIGANGRGGSDNIIGSQLGDLLNGGDGSDYIRGQGGNDILIGGPGSDILDGQAGADTADFSAAVRRVKVNLAIGLAVGDGIDRLIQMENVTGSAFDDRILGNDLGNHLIGGLGNDRLKGLAGDDTVDGGAGDDFLHGGSGNDILLGAADNDRLLGQSGRDLLVGGLGSDGLVGGADDDILVAGVTDHDADLAALNAIMAEWTSVRSYSVRVNNLRDGSGSVDGVNGSVFLSAGDTVEDDAAADLLSGSSGLDWFFARTAAPTVDVVADQAIGELLDEI